MPNEGYISAADISGITREIASLRNQLYNTNDGIEILENNIKVVANQVNDTTVKVSQVQSDIDIIQAQVNELHATVVVFFRTQERRNNVNEAGNALVRIKQEIEKRFGHYDVVRRTGVGILQAGDLSIVSKQSITNLTEELMLTVPDYWLAPCLVALGAWIKNDRPLAEKALAEGVRRDQEKTSLFFGLVCSRAGRNEAAFKWLEKYLSIQSPYELDNTTLAIFDAYTAGVFGHDAEGLISRHINSWFAEIENQPGFEEDQISKWKGILSGLLIGNSSSYADDCKYLPKYAKNWNDLKTSAKNSLIYGKICSYLNGISSLPDEEGRFKEKLDSILLSLVSNYDDEEASLKKEAQLNEYIIELKGDIDSAQKKLSMESTSFEAKRNFADMLSTALAGKTSELTSTTKKYILGLSVQWISKACDDISAANISAMPACIDIELDGMKFICGDGSEETKLLEELDGHINKTKEESILKATHKFERDYSPIAVWILGLIAAICAFICFYPSEVMISSRTFDLILKSMAFPGSDADAIKIIAKVLGLFCSIFFLLKLVFNKDAKKEYADEIAKINKIAEERRNADKPILKAVIAEISSLKLKIKEKTEEGINNVKKVLSGITPKSYISSSE